MQATVLSLSIQTSADPSSHPRFSDLTPQEAIGHLSKYPAHFVACDISLPVHSDAPTTLSGSLVGDSELVSLLLSRVTFPN